MSSSDLFVAGFPHGTPNGYQKGCRSNGVCPAKLETGQSCKEANIRVSRDAVYRALVQSGADVSALAQPEVDAAPAKVPGARPAKHQAIPKMLQEKPAPALPDDTRLGRELAADLPELDHRPVSEQMPAVPAEPERKRPGRKPKPIVHGTVTGYLKGCRDDCPADEDGRTCRRAKQDASNVQRAARRERAQQAPATPTRVRPVDERDDPTTAAPLLADLAVAFDTLDEETRRSPQVVTPFDGMDGLMASLLRAAWLDGYTRAVTA